MVSTRNRSTNQPPQSSAPNDKLLHGNVDELNINIVKALVENPYISSTEIASKYGIPLSTVQRRRAKLESSLLTKEYSIDIRRLGWRIGDLLIAVEKGKAEETAGLLLKNKICNALSASLRIGHPQVDIMANVFYRDSQELHKITETVKAMPNVTSVEWAEVVKVVGRNSGIILDKVFANV